MDQKRHAASKVTDFQRYHLSGDLDQELEGRVSSVRLQFEMAVEIPEGASPEELQKLLDDQQKEADRLQQEMIQLELRNKIEAESLRKQ